MANNSPQSSQSNSGNAKGFQVNAKDSEVYQAGNDINIDQSVSGSKIEQDVDGDQNLVIGEAKDNAIIIKEISGSSTVTIVQSTPALKLGAPFLAPPLSYYYVPRPEHSEKVKAELLATGQKAPGTLVVSAIYGLGGIGKSVLAAALAHDPEVQEHFKDGVLWVTLGQDPDLLPELSLWLQALGDYNSKPTALDSAILQLRLLLQEKQMLLVIDDVWETAHAEPFRVGGQHCGVLITTREAAIKDCTRYSLDEMTAQQSLTLLTQKLKQELTLSEVEQANALAQKVGYLPLALELAAAQIEDGVDWRELLEDLEEEITNLATLDDPLLVFEGDQPEKQIRNRSLYASFNLSLKRLPPEQIKQFAWLGILPDDVAVNAAVASKLWNIKPKQARTLLQGFMRKSLLMEGGKQAVQGLTFRMHDLVHDIARCMLTHDPEASGVFAYGAIGLPLAKAHSVLLERYRAQTPNGLWHGLESDGYIYAQLTWHMKQAEQEEQIHQLFQETTAEGRNGWYEACDRLGKLSYFVMDLGRAWKLAEELFEQNPTESIVLQWRYALIQSTLNTLAQNIPAELLARFVETGFWSPAQGLAYAQQIQSPNGRSQAISQLAKHLPESLLPEALEVATHNINDEFARALVLSALASQLPELWTDALEATRNIHNEDHRATVLSYLAPQLPESMWPEVLEMTRNINYEDPRARVLSALAPQMPELWSEALEATYNINDEYCCAEVLSALAPQLPEYLLTEALEVTNDIDDESSRVLALSALAHRLPESLMLEALEMTRNINNESYRVEVLSALATHWPALWSEALEMTRNIDEYSRAKALSTLAPQMPTLWSEALDATHNISNESYRAEALNVIVPQLPESLFHKALEVTHNINDESSRSSTLSALAPQLPESLLSNALEVTRNINDGFSRAETLRALAPKIPDLWLEALEVTRSIKDESSRAEALSALARQMPEIFPEAWEVTRNINDEGYRSRTLSALAPQLPESMLPEALEVTHNIKDEYFRAKALSALAPQLPESLWPKALEMAYNVNDEGSRAEVLRALAPQLEELWPEALQVTRNIDEYALARAICAIAPQLPEYMLHEALDIARCDINYKASRAEALRALAPRLPELWLEALEVTRSIKDESSRAWALNALAPQFLELWPEALEVTRNIKDDYSRACVLCTLASQLPESLLPEALQDINNVKNISYRAKALSGYLSRLDLSTNELWFETLHILSSQQRQALILDLPKLENFMVALGGEATLNGALGAMQAVSEQWK